jgi:tetratricopeptide (TPR) repeat protein
MIDLLKDIFKKLIHTWVGFIIGCLLLFLTIIIPSDSFLQKGINDFGIRLIIYGALEVAWFLFWKIFRSYLPKIMLGKVGVFVAINAENDKQKKRIGNDFTRGIEDSLRKHNLSELVHLITLEDFRAEKVSNLLSNYSMAQSEVRKTGSISPSNKRNIRKFNKLRKKINAHFFIWGSIKERIEEENKYFITLDGLVIHKPVDIITSNSIITEFLNIFPNKISVLERREFQGFEIASNLISIGITYMSGIAALVSGDPFIAFNMHKGLLGELKKFKPIPPNIAHVIRNLKALQATELFHQSRYYYFVKKDIQKADKLIESAEKLDNNIYDIKVFRCYRAFSDRRDFSSAIKYVESAGDLSENLLVDDFTWLYNKAFLLLYLGKFHEAIKLYDKIENKEFIKEESTVDQCIKFDSEILNQEPDKIQIHFVLGFLYLKKKSDFKKADYHFKKFLEKASNITSYNLLCEKTERYLAQMN